MPTVDDLKTSIRKDIDKLNIKMFECDSEKKYLEKTLATIEEREKLFEEQERNERYEKAQQKNLVKQVEESAGDSLIVVGEYKDKTVSDIAKQIAAHNAKYSPKKGAV